MSFCVSLSWSKYSSKSKLGVSNMDALLLSVSAVWWPDFKS